MATLPRTDFLRDDPRIDLAAAMIPAREVGGDLYDFFRLDDRRLFLLVGDVAGKGLSASIFMAVSKALYKSTMLRAPDARHRRADVRGQRRSLARQPGDAVRHRVRRHSRSRVRRARATATRARQPVSRRIRRTATVRRIEDGGRAAAVCGRRLRLRGAASAACGRARWLCVVTDGVTEARVRSESCTAARRVRALLQRLATANTSAGAVVDALRADVDAFAAGAEPADDLTVLVLRWNGARAGGAAAQA